MFTNIEDRWGNGYVIVDYTSKQVAGVDDGNYVYAGNTSPNIVWVGVITLHGNGFHLGVLVTGRFGRPCCQSDTGLDGSYGVSKSTVWCLMRAALRKWSAYSCTGFLFNLGPSVGSWYVYKATNVRFGVFSFRLWCSIRKYVSLDWKLMSLL